MLLLLTGDGSYSEVLRPTRHHLFERKSWTDERAPSTSFADRNMGTGSELSDDDCVDGWLIKRKLDREQNYVCRVCVPGCGSWFSTHIRLEFTDVLVIPGVLIPPNKASVVLAHEALRLCRLSLLYFKGVCADSVL